MDEIQQKALIDALAAALNRDYLANLDFSGGRIFYAGSRNGTKMWRFLDGIGPQIGDTAGGKFINRQVADLELQLGVPSGQSIKDYLIGGNLNYFDGILEATWRIASGIYAGSAPADNYAIIGDNIDANSNFLKEERPLRGLRRARRAPPRTRAP